MRRKRMKKKVRKGMTMYEEREKERAIASQKKVTHTQYQRGAREVVAHSPAIAIGSSVHTILPTFCGADKA